MNNDELISLVIRTPERIVFNENIYSLTIKANQGFIGLMRNHTPFVSNIEPCKFEIKLTKTSTSVVEGFISTGIIYADQKSILVIGTNATLKEGVSKKEIKEKLEELQKDITDSKENNIEILKNLELYYKLILEDISIN